MIRRVRRLLLLPVVLVVALVGVIAPAAGSGSTPITQTEALAFIRAVNLQPSDLSGSGPFQGEAGSPPGTAEIQHGALRCGHPGKARGIAVAAESAPLSIPYLHGTKLAGEDFVASLVIVMPNDALATAEIAALGSWHGRACLAHGLSTESAPPYATTVRFVPVAQLLGRAAIAVHVVQRRRVRPRAHRPLPPSPALLYSAEAIFRVGAADIVFFAASKRRQFPAATEVRLLALLHQRAMAHRL
jgi:hypothetical protein